MVKHAAALGIVLLGLSRTSAAPTGAVDPWKKVPATPTSCYADEDFATKLNATMQETLADSNRQTELNAKVTERFNSMDPMEKAQRMQAWMMSNPQAATKMLEASVAAGEAASTSMVEVNEAAQKLDKELAGHKSAFDTAVDEALKPVLAKEEAFVKAKTTLIGEAQVPAFTNAADHAQYVAIVQEENAAYEKACAPFFGPKGIFDRWLQRYRAEVIDKLIAFGETNDAAMRQQMAFMDSPTEGYRSPAVWDGVRDYLDRLYKVAGYRRSKATPRIELEK